MQVSIRRLDQISINAEAIANLVCQLGYPASPEDIQERLSKIKNSPEDLILFAENDSNHLLGFIHLRITCNLHQPTFLEIVALVVDEKMRGQSVGRHLIEAAELYGRERKASLIWLRTGAHREKAHHFYESLGYERKTTSYKYVKELSS